MANFNTAADLYGGVEAGGTKFVCAVGCGPNDLTEIRFPTSTPAETLGRAIEFFTPYKHRLKALGIASFGPLDLKPESPTFGQITSTPKPGWANTDIVTALGGVLAVPVGFDTDVNGAALAEGRWGAARGLQTYVYFTLGTGIGGGVIVGGQALHGLVHPELGHCMLPKHPSDNYPGKCPFHGDLCFEGLASGPALEERWQRPAQELPQDHFAWELQAYYVSMAMVNTICTLSPQRIILGGGVMEQEHLFEKIRHATQQTLQGYIKHRAIVHNIRDYIVPPELGDKAGIVGAIELAKNA
ncbi:fructokinase [Alteromonadaceae bacterium 2753L.S.0a.02]|nr:fructokinase [Alteromonadaceae bacterium 2753L.S.0a.02]